MPPTNWDMLCRDCGWTGDEETAAVVTTPSPDGVECRAYACPDCANIDSMRYD